MNTAYEKLCNMSKTVQDAHAELMAMLDYMPIDERNAFVDKFNRIQVEKSNYAKLQGSPRPVQNAHEHFMDMLRCLAVEERNVFVDRFNRMQTKNDSTVDMEISVKQDMHTFSSGMVRSTDADDVRYDLIPNEGLERIAATLQQGAVKYGEHNWKKGMPIGECLNHAIRHIYRYLEGDKSEDHLAHASCNLLFCMYYEMQEK